MLCLLLPAGAAHADALGRIRAVGVLRVAASPDNPSFSVRGADGAQAGCDIDLTRAPACAADRAAFEILPDSLTIDDMAVAMRSGSRRYWTSSGPGRTRASTHGGSVTRRATGSPGRVRPRRFGRMRARRKGEARN